MPAGLFWHKNLVALPRAADKPMRTLAIHRVAATGRVSRNPAALRQRNDSSASSPPLVTSIAVESLFDHARHAKAVQVSPKKTCDACRLPYRLS